MLHDVCGTSSESQRSADRCCFLSVRKHIRSIPEVVTLPLYYFIKDVYGTSSESSESARTLRCVYDTSSKPACFLPEARGTSSESRWSFDDVCGTSSESRCSAHDLHPHPDALPAQHIVNLVIRCQTIKRQQSP